MKLPVAAITMVFNESVFLPIWLNYYGSTLGHENLFIIDDGSDDMSVREKKIINLVSRKRGALDEFQRAKTISYFHEELLKYYDVVLYTDADEIIVPEPNLELSLKDYLVTRNTNNWINPVGLNVLHDRRREGPLDLSKPLFSQRSHARFDEEYCKPVIARIPMRWPPGFHGSLRPPCYAADLFLFHLRAMDYDISRARIRNLNSVSFSEDSLRRNESPQFRMREQEYLNLFFSTPEAEFQQARSELDFSDELAKLATRPGGGRWHSGCPHSRSVPKCYRADHRSCTDRRKRPWTSRFTCRRAVFESDFLLNSAGSPRPKYAMPMWIRQTIQTLSRTACTSYVGLFH